MNSEFLIEGKRIPLMLLPINHPTIEYACNNLDGLLDWPSLYGMLRRPNVTSVFSSDSIPLCVVICYSDYEDEYFLMDQNEWLKMGEYLRPLNEEKVNWTKEGF